MMKIILVPAVLVFNLFVVERVLAQPVFTKQPMPTTQTVCLNGTPGSYTVLATPSSGSVTYQWYSNAANSNTGGTMLIGQSTATFTPPTTSNGTVYYYCVAKDANGPSPSNTAEVIVTSTSFSQQPLITQTECQSTAATALTVIAAGNGAPTYAWYSNTANLNSGGASIGGATSNTYTPPTGSAGTLYYYCVATTTCGSLPSNTATVIVNPSITFSGQPDVTQTDCQSTAPTALSVTPGGTAPFTYHWWSNITNVNSGGTDLGITSSSYSPPTGTPGTLYYYCVVGSGCGSAPSNTATVTVTPSTTFGSQPLPATQMVCQTGSTMNATPTSIIATATGTGTVSYQWYTNATNSNSGGTSNGSSGGSFTPPTAAVGTTYYYCVASSSCSSATSNTAAVTINPITTITTEPPLKQTVCQGGTPTVLNMAATGTGTLTYQWYYNLTNSNSGGTSVGTAGSNSSYSPPTNVSGTRYYFCVASSLVCGTAPTTTVQTLVDSVPTPPFITYGIANEVPTICQNANNLNYFVSSNNPGGSVKYGWNVAAFSNASLETTGGPDDSAAIISFSSGGTATIIATDTLYSTKCFNADTLIVPLSSSSAAADVGRVVYDGTSYICLNNTVGSFLWGYDDINLVSHVFTGADVLFLNQQNMSFPSQPTADDIAATTPKALIWCITTTGSCSTKNYYIDPAPGQQVPPPVSISEPIRIYPNPVTDVATIAWAFSSATDRAVIIVSDLTGRKLIEQVVGVNATPGQTAIDVSALKPGLYLVNVLQNNKTTAVGKLVKYKIF